MKKIALTLAALAAVFGCFAAEPNAPVNVDAKKILIAYFSHTSNTRAVARFIHKATGGDIFEIVPVNSYPDGPRQLSDQARKELDTGFKPELKTKVEDISRYDVIFIGSPNWWSSIAPPVTAFLSSYDLKGKTIIPFMTHERSLSGRSVAMIKELCPESTVLDSLPIRGTQARSSEKEVTQWVEQVVKIK